MRVFLDENLPRKFARALADHEVRTARQMSWNTLKNGKLLALVAPAFDVFVTMDRGLEHQQNLGRLDLAVVVLRARSNKLADLLPWVPELLAALPVAPKGKVTAVGDWS